MRNFLFGAPGAGGFDLAALNIQRGRDHGLPAYNGARVAFGLGPAADFADITGDAAVQARLAAAYATPDEVDLWVGGLAEDPVAGRTRRPAGGRILIAQFTALRDGDRLSYRRTLSPQEVRMVESIRLADVIRWNTTIRRGLQDNVFRARSVRR